MAIAGRGSVPGGVAGEGAATPIRGAMPEALAGCIGVDGGGGVREGAEKPLEAKAFVDLIVVMEELQAIKRMVAALNHRFGVQT